MMPVKGDAPPTRYPGDALQAAEAGAASVAMATPKKELGVNFFSFQSKATCLKKNLTFHFGWLRSPPCSPSLHSSQHPHRAECLNGPKSPC